MIHVGIIGGGGISETHARAARETDGVRVAAVYGENRERAARLADAHGAKVYESLDALLAHEPLDVVLIGSPSGLHAEQGIAAARRGRHVLVEKPLDITTERADRLIEECARARIKLGVFFQDRAAPDIIRLKSLVEEGALGRPILASGCVRWYRPPEYYAGSRWRGTWALDGGGALMNQGVHTVDLLLWLMGDVRRVYAKAVTALHDIEVEDTLVATLEFESGAVGTLEAATSVFPGYRRRVELTGSEGTLVLEHDRLIAVDLKSAPADLDPATEESRNASASSPVVSDVRGHRAVLADFLRAVADDRAPLCDGREGRRSVELVEAIYESSRTGLPVSLRG